MAFGKTDEQKAAERQAKADAAYWASPLGRAHRAKETGARFFQVEIPHSSIGGIANLAWTAGGTSQRTQRHGAAPDLLGQIEELGWHLEQASWVYVQTGQNSRDKFLASGQHVVVQGEVIGIYLFRSR